VAITAIPDISGGDSTVSLYNTPELQSGANCKSGNCVNFDGASSWINASSINAKINVNAGTIVLWVKRIFVNSDPTAAIISFRADSNNNIEIFRQTLSTWIFRYEAGGTASQITPALDDIPKDQWTQIAFSWDKSADEVKAYINGIQTGSTVTGLGIWAGSVSQGDLGSSQGGTAAFFKGLVDEVRIYDHALSSDKILNLYNDFK
jgi:hypothetical protein